MIFKNQLDLINNICVTLKAVEGINNATNNC